MKTGAVSVWIQHNLVYLLTGVLGLWMIIGYNKQVRVEKEGLKKLRVFMDYLDTVVYQYTISQSVEEAVQEALEGTGEEIRDVIEDIYEALLEEDEEKIRGCKGKYEYSFFFQFLIYSHLAIVYGDNSQNSMYISNLMFLKKQIFAWKLDREKLIHYFQGLIFLTIVPVQCFKLIEIWAQNNLADMSRYYEQGYGIITRFLLLFLSILCYQTVLWLRSNYEVQFHSGKTLRYIADSTLVENCYIWWAGYHPNQVRKLSLLLRESSARITLQEFWTTRHLVGGAALICSFVLLEPMVSLSQSYRYLFIFIGIFVTGMFYHLPVWYLSIRVRLIRLEKEDESFFFYSIAQMIAESGEGDVLLVLEWLELAGRIFVPTLEYCMDEYMFDSEQALEGAIHAEPFAPFDKLMNVLLVSELVGLKTAAVPLEQEKAQFIEKRKQDNQIRTENKGVLGRFVAFIPMTMVIGLYLIVPFILESLMQLKEYVRQIQVGL